MTRHRIDKSKLTISTGNRLESNKHLQFVARHACLVCAGGDLEAREMVMAQSAHVSYLGKRYGCAKAFGAKVHDYLTVPLCPYHHDEQSNMSEREFWILHEIDPEPRIRCLMSRSPDARVRAVLEEAA